MRRALVVAAILAVTLAARAHPAPGAARTPVVGGGSFNTAPLVGPGRYRDTILPGERLFYGIKLAAGQRLRVGGKLGAAPGTVVDAAAGFAVGIQTPLREVDVLDLVDQDISGNGTVTTGDTTDRLEFVSVPVLTGSAARDEGITYRGPGVWYVSLYLISNEQDPPRAEFPVNLDLRVIGTPQRDPNPERTAAKPAPEPGESDDGGGTSIGTVIAVALAGLALGAALGGAAAVAARRRRPA